MHLLIEAAETRQVFKIGQFTAALLGNIRAAGPVEYLYLLIVFEGNSQTPCLIVASEVNQLASRLGGGSHFLGLFRDESHSNLGSSDDWADEARFTQEALRIVQKEMGNDNGDEDEKQGDGEIESRLIEPISDAELERLNAKFNRYEALGPRWQEFLSHRKEGDTLWRYWDGGFKVKGIVIVRSGAQIERFWALGDL